MNIIFPLTISLLQTTVSVLAILVSLSTMPTETEALHRWAIKTRSQAFTDGDHRYFTGKPCKHGHWEQRAVASGMCLACNRMYSDRFRAGSNPLRLVPVSVVAHPDDWEAIRAYATALTTARQVAVDAVGAFDVDAARASVHGAAVAAAIPPGAPKPTPR